MSAVATPSLWLFVSLVFPAFDDDFAVEQGHLVGVVVLLLQHGQVVDGGLEEVPVATGPRAQLLHHFERDVPTPVALDVVRHRALGKAVEQADGWPRGCRRRRRHRLFPVASRGRLYGASIHSAAATGQQLGVGPLVLRRVASPHVLVRVLDPVVHLLQVLEEIEFEVREN